MSGSGCASLEGGHFSLPDADADPGTTGIGRVCMNRCFQRRATQGRLWIRRSGIKIGGHWK